jgi:uncharacterized LabA/DUF88 family protein
MLRTYVYIDGFNLYYGAVKDTPYKWLDFKALFNRILQNHNQIEAIKYFTAKVSGKLDPRQPIRQQTYLRALQAHIPEIRVHFGHFLVHVRNMKLAKPIAGREFADVIRQEEKGSDVNLAVHLLHDAWLNLYDCAVVVSNDSDLAEAMRLVKIQHDKVIGLIVPHKHQPSAKLCQYADFVKKIKPEILGECQLPDPIPGTNLHKPSSW